MYYLRRAKLIQFVPNLVGISLQIEAMKAAASYLSQAFLAVLSVLLGAVEALKGRRGSVVDSASSR